MVVSALAGAALGTTVSKISDAIIHVIKKTWRFRSELTKLQKTITRIKPMIDEIEAQTKLLDRPEHEQKMFIAQMKGAEALILKCEVIKWNFYKRYTHAVKLDALNASMRSFFQIDVQLAMFSGIRDLQVGKNVLISMMKRELGRSSSSVPLLKDSVIGFEDRVKELKAMVFKESVGDECSVVVVSAAGGCGKTTLVTAVCLDPEIQAKFGSNIYFVTISENPDLTTAVKNLLGRNKADFVNEDDAINQWGSYLGEIGSEILLVLDDVWCDSIINRFKLKLHGYKILVTSRTTFPQFNTYQLQLLNYQDAIKMFRYYAFSEGGSQRTDIPDDLVVKLVKCCKEHPLSLSVIGGLLKGTRVESWLGMLKELSQSILNLPKSIQIENCLARSLNVLKEESVIKQCYMDLGLFPEDQKIPATMLMDIWVHLYKHDEEGLATFNHILELSYKNLATLLPIRENSHIGNYCEEKTVVQHDLMRTLAIRLSSQEPIADRKRLIINANGNGYDFPQLPHTINARILSISTGLFFPIFENDDIQTPEVEVFVMNFMSKTYKFPKFMETMEKLKVLIITNYGYKYSDLQNFPSPQYISDLTTIRLEHVSISSISASILELTHLRKLSLLMCKIGDSFNESKPNKLPNLLEIVIDYCDDLITFPLSFCNLSGLKTLCITNCLELISLSEEFGNLMKLEVLRLASCSNKNFKELPESMTKLQNLRVIDLSDCLHLEKLPGEIGKLGGLQTIHMRGCTGLHELPLSVKDLCPLEVVCNEEIEVLWREFTDVKIKLVEEDRIATFSKITQSNKHVWDV